MSMVELAECGEKTSPLKVRETRRLSEPIRTSRKVQTPVLRKSSHEGVSSHFSQLVHNACRPVILAKSLKIRDFSNGVFYLLDFRVPFCEKAVQKLLITCDVIFKNHSIHWLSGFHVWNLYSKIGICSTHRLRS